ncbi:hypothetical protein V6K52_17315 [Knoellia sp. S7-12]|uniref:hypothetical protein n=1 Tax=Knoellia sp. S7-12 TaxID=3126698 RepID=UPI00336859CA
MITDVVIVPGAPLLLPEYQGRISAAPGLIESCITVVREAVASAHHVVVVHATDRDARSTKPAVGLRVADHLLAATHENFDVEHVAVAWDATLEECVDLGRGLEPQGATTLLVVADGSARRTEKAPGHLDPRATDIDDVIVDAVRTAGESGLERLLDLDPELCADLLVAGRAPLQVLAAAVGSAGDVASADTAALATTSADAGVRAAAGGRTAYRVESCEVSDPFGVLYVVAHLVAT